MSVDAPSRVKSKNLNVLEEFEKSDQKKSASFVVIGNFMFMNLVLCTAVH